MAQEPSRTVESGLLSEDDDEGLQFTMDEDIDSTAGADATTGGTLLAAALRSFPSSWLSPRHKTFSIPFDF